MSTFTVDEGDSLELMRPLETASFDAAITDPPYGLGFMGAGWDKGVPPAEYWSEARRLVKPGGRLLAFGAPRTMHRIWTAIEDGGWTIEDTIGWIFAEGWPKHGSKLKPAWEPICLARNGPSELLNIDACRIPMSEEDAAAIEGMTGFGSGEYETKRQVAYQGKENIDSRPHEGGRWPANIILDEGAAQLLDAQSGERKPGGTYRRDEMGSIGYGGSNGDDSTFRGYGDTGGASRFFFCPKAKRGERERGLEGLEKVSAGKYAQDKWSRENMGNIPDERRKPVANDHPTVKPIELMRWLVRLVLVPGQRAIDPFCGSGTTGIACMIEGVAFHGLEKEARYAEIARRRIAAAPLSLFG